MYCPKCGTQNDDNAFKCVECGEIIQITGASVAPSDQKVSTHLAPAIIVTLLCCLPFGIVAIVYAAKVNGKLKAGDYVGAKKASDRSKVWCWVAFGSGVFYLIIALMAAIAIPQFAAYRVRSYDSAAKVDLWNAATAQEAYHADNQKYTASLDDLVGTNYGLSINQDVTLEIIHADEDSYHMIAFHTKGSKKFQIKGPGGTLEVYQE